MFDGIEWIAIISGAFCLGGFWLFRHSRRMPHQLHVVPLDEGQSSVSNIFWIALVVRLVVGFLIALTDTADYFAPDRWAYERIGRALADHWAGRGFMTSTLASEARPYHYYNAAFFFLAGEAAPWIIRSLNSVAGAAGVFLVYEIARSIYDRRTSRFAAWLVALCPSMVLWSALNIRDAWAGLAVLIIVVASLRLRDRISVASVMTLVAGLALLGAMRGYMFLLIAVGVVLSYVGGIRGGVVRNYVAGLIVLVAFLYLYASLGFGKQMLDTASFEMLNSQRQGMTSGADSAFYQNVDISSPGKALGFLPIGMTFFLFAPFPWMVKKLSQLLTQPEMFAWWYLAFRYLGPGIREGIRRRAGHTMTLCSVSLISIMAYGLVEGNVGTAYRHRAQVLPLLLILAAGGWVAKRRTVAQDARLDDHSLERSSGRFIEAGGGVYER